MSSKNSQNKTTVINFTPEFINGVTELLDNQSRKKRIRNKMTEVIIFLGIAPFVVLLNGWALSLLWAWFIVPVFALPTLSLGQSAGISMIVLFMTSKYNKQDDEDYSSSKIAYLLIKPLMAVLVGLVIKQFILS